MKENEIYDLLDEGWVYCMPFPNDDYFEKRFFSHISPREKIKFGEGYFVKKSQQFFDRLVSFGMRRDSPNYDACVVLSLSRGKQGEGAINMLSLKSPDDLKKVARDIFKKG